MRKRSRVIFLWLIWSITMSLVFYTVENRIIREKAREELQDQANIISEQLSVLAENDFCAEAGDSKAQNARLKALSLLLDHVETLEDARPLLDEFTESTDADGLVVYDREGNILYAVGDAAGINDPADIVQILLDQHLFEIMDQALVWIDVYHDYLFSSQIFDDSEDYICWSAHQDQWLLAAHTRPSKAKAEVINYFDWRTVFRRIPIGKTGALLAVDQTDETILSWEDRTLEGETLNALNLQLPGNAAAVSLEELKAAFSQPCKTQEVQIGGKAYLAARVDEERMLTLALLPMDEIREDVFSATGVLALLTLSVTGVCAGYAFFHTVHKGEGLACKVHFDLLRDDRLKVHGFFILPAPGFVVRAELAVGVVFLLRLLTDTLVLVPLEYHGHVLTVRHGNMDRRVIRVLKGSVPTGTDSAPRTICSVNELRDSVISDSLRKGERELFTGLECAEKIIDPGLASEPLFCQCPSRHPSSVVPDDDFFVVQHADPS